MFGWAKPVPVDKRRLRNPRFGMMAVAAAGPASNLVLAAIGGGRCSACCGARCGILLGRKASSGFVALSLLYTFILINVFLALFNLLPIPPFDGSHIVEGLLPARAARVYDGAAPYGFPLMIAAAAGHPMAFPGSGIVERVVLPPVEWVHRQLPRASAAGLPAY